MLRGKRGCPLKKARGGLSREKQGYLIELEKLRAEGVQISRPYSMSDNLEDIQFEYDRHRSNIDTLNAVNFMRDGMQFLFQGIEMANSKWGPVLQLDGWSKDVTKDMQRYINVLERLYKKDWRKGSMAPEMELSMLVGGSMFTVSHSGQDGWGQEQRAR